MDFKFFNTKGISFLISIFVLGLIIVSQSVESLDINFNLKDQVFFIGDEVDFETEVLIQDAEYLNIKNISFVVEGQYRTNKIIKDNVRAVLKVDLKNQKIELTSDDFSSENLDINYLEGCNL